MSDREYTPTTEDVRRDYAAMRDEHMYSPSIQKSRQYRENGGGGAEFDRWLAGHDADVLRRVAADDPDNLGLSGLLVAALSRADAAEAKIAAVEDLMIASRGLTGLISTGDIRAALTTSEQEQPDTPKNSE